MSDILRKLIESNVLLKAIGETVVMTLGASVFSYIIGLPLGIALYATDKQGLRPLPWLHKLLDVIVNVLRSVPFVILMVAVIPVAKAVVGTGMGNKAMVVTLVIASFAYVARLVESSIKEVPYGMIEATRAMGANNLQIIFKVLIPEAKPSLIVCAVIACVTILGYSAMAGTIGGGGLGTIAITYGYQRFNDDVIWVCVALTVVIVQIIQEIGSLIARKSDKRLKNKGVRL